MKYFIAFCLLAFLCTPSLRSQEAGSLDWDIDTIFDEPLPELPTEETNEKPAAPPAAAPPVSSPASAPIQVKRRGLTFDASFRFVGGISPGLQEAPWFADDDNEFSWGQEVKMRATYSLDAQISQVFRVKNTLYFEIPNFSLKLGDFFLDYSLYDRVFLRAGKYSLSWGISPNFEFADLLARVPSDEEYHKQYKDYYNSESYIVKADIPLGVGGFQLLAMTRANLMRNVMPGWLHIGYGAKYNLALRRVDIDLGFFYQDYMPFRGFLSVKTTLGNTELYNDWLATDILHPDTFSGAVSLGVVHEFFNKKLRVNAELLYNGEENALWYRPQTIIRAETTSPFMEGPNGALNLLFRFGGKGDPRIFLRGLYAPLEDSARLIPGFRLSPWPNVEFYLAVPMDIGSKTGYYYVHNEDPEKRHFSVVMLLTFRGSVRAGYYY